jgi:RimJ/RimL family protein N-acetyltransferase
MDRHNLELMKGRHVRLREMVESDAPYVVEWRNRPEMRDWLIQWEELTVEAHLRWFEGRIREGDLLLVFESLDGKPIGSSSLQDFDRPGTSAEWGRLCSAKIGGHPHEILEGCYLLHRLSFEVMHMFRLHGAVATENDRAWRLYQFLGWREEGIRRKHWAKSDGSYFDARVIGIFPDEFALARPHVEAKLYGAEPVPSVSEEHAARARQHLARGR